MKILNFTLSVLLLSGIHAFAAPTPLSQIQAEMRNLQFEKAIAIADQAITTTQRGGNAVLGLADTLTAVQHGRASHVVALASYAQPAYRFIDSGHIVLDLTEDADLQSGRVQSLPDAVESCLRRALAQNIGVTLLDQHEGLERAGKIGALTRY